MVLQNRDKEILNFIDCMGAATTTQITKIFFNGLKYGKRIAQRRLELMHKEKLLKRYRSNINAEYCYYIKGSQQIHQLIRTEFYIKLLELGGSIREFEIQKKIEHVIPDGFITYDYKGYRHLIFLEVERSNNKFNQDKYQELLSKRVLQVFPKVVVISDREIEFSPSLIKFYKLKTDCEGINNVLEV